MQDKQTNKPSSESSIKTYTDLEAAYLAHLRLENKSEQDLKNFRSNLNSWCQVFKVDKHSPITPHFGEKFSVSLEKYKTNQLKNGAKASTIASKSSKLKKINEFLIVKESLANLSPNFGERLKQLIRNAGYKGVGNFWSFCLDGKCLFPRFNNWCRGIKLPSEESRELIVEIEKLLNVPAETLTSLLRSTHNQKKGVRKQTVIGKRMQEISSYSYRVWEKHLEKELQELVKFKTDSVLPSGIKRNNNAIWTSSEGAGFGTADFAERELKSFFGYLCLSKNASDPLFRGKGYAKKKKKLTLGLLADLDLVESFVTGFKKLRSFNKYNNGHIHFLSVVTSLLRPETGYLYQNPTFAVKVGMSGDAEEWQNKCTKTRNRLLDIAANIKYAKKSGNKDFQKGRDPKEPIADILALPNPLTAIKELISIMLSDVNSYPPGIKRAVFYRDILLIALLVSNPLRVKMFTIMKFGRNLIRKEDGSWWIKFNREDFKNRSSLDSDYEVEITPEVFPLIERYQREFRPLFFGAEESDYVFLKDRDNSERKRRRKKTLIYKSVPAVKDIYSFTSAVLSGRISIRIKSYFPLSPGFRAHAFRHIVATSIIKSNPELGFFLASKVLHDKFETVEREYAHIKTTEFFRPYNRILSDLLKGVINEDGTGNPSTKDGGGK